VPSIEDALAKEEFLMLFKGEVSCGKSIAAASFPKPYIFDMESRIRSVAAYHYPRGKRDLEYDTYTREDYSKFDKKWDDFIDMSKMKRFPYDTVIVDSLTSTADLLLQNVIRLKGLDGKGKKIAGVAVSSIEDFNAENSMLTELVMFLQQIRCKYKILIAHVIKTEKTNLNDDTTVVTRQLLTGGKKVAAKIPGYFDEIYHFEQKPVGGKQTFIARTVNSGEDFARTTLKLPKEINFTDKNFYELIQPSIQEVMSLGQTNVTPFVQPTSSK
jgi:hypothetical protein